MRERQRADGHIGGSDTQWLTYWVIFGGFNFLESMSSVLVAWYVPSSSSSANCPPTPLRRFPYYYTVKTLFIIFLILPFVLSSCPIQNCG